MNSRKSTVATNVCFLLLLAAGVCSNSLAMKPFFTTSGLLLIEPEGGPGRTKTGITSMLYGTGTWLEKYNWEIGTYLFYNPDDNFWTYLPFYGYTRVTAEKLASMVIRDYDLGLRQMPYSTYQKLVDALNTDRSYGYGYYSNAVDPYGNWKWRSVFMEGRYAENGDPEMIMSNCWGNANYLTRSWEWADGYPSYRQWALDYGMDNEAASFPHIYLDGWIVGNDYSIDADLSNDNGSFFGLEGVGDIGGGLKNMINSFDVIRMADQPGYPRWGHSKYELRIGNTNLGQNSHCAVYLSTDDSGKPWFYQKGNFGSTAGAPYGLHAFGLNPNWDYEDDYRSYFMHRPDRKRNETDNWDIDWAHVD